MTQKERVLRALKNAGSQGIVSSDFLDSPADGGSRILRVPARVHDLKVDGHVIEARWDSKMGQERYVLVKGRSVESCGGAVVESEEANGAVTGAVGRLVGPSEGLFDAGEFETEHDWYESEAA